MKEYTAFCQRFFEDYSVQSNNRISATQQSRSINEALEVVISKLNEIKGKFIDCKIISNPLVSELPQLGRAGMVVLTCEIDKQNNFRTYNFINNGFKDGVAGSTDEPDNFVAYMEKSMAMLNASHGEYIHELILSYAINPSSPDLGAEGDIFIIYREPNNKDNK